MSVSGPKKPGGRPRIGATDNVESGSAVAKTPAARGVREPFSVGESASAAVQPAAAPVADGPFADIITKLESGAINKVQAREALVNRAVDMHGGLLSPKHREAMREALSATLAEDPYLAALLAGE